MSLSKFTHITTPKSADYREGRRRKKAFCEGLQTYKCVFWWGLVNNFFFLSFCSLMKLCVIPRKLLDTIINLLYSAAKKMLFENSVEFFYLQLNKLTFFTPFHLPLPHLHRLCVSHRAILLYRELKGRKLNYRW
jgi:hypothetical protein